MTTIVTTTAFVLRPAADDEFWAVARLFAALHQFNAELDLRFRLAEGREPLLRQHFVRTHRSPGALWLLAWHDGKPVGLLLLETHTDSPLFAEQRWAKLMALSVAPGERGGDRGPRLVEVGKHWAAARDFDRLQLYVTASNERARRFYARCGLAPVLSNEGKDPRTGRRSRRNERAHRPQAPARGRSPQSAQRAA